MKRFFLLCLLGMAALDLRAATSNPPQPVQPFTAVVWTTTTLHSPAGKASIFMRRTVYTRDASGNVRRELYRERYVKPKFYMLARGSACLCFH
jgi:hypothetical protein